MAVIGFDLGGTKLASAIFTDEGEIIFKEILSLNKKSGADVGLLITDQLKKLMKQSSKKIDAVGVCVPGISYRKTGTVWAPNIPGWENYPLMDDLMQAVNNEEIKIEIDSDRSCYILGEVWKGAARNCSDAAFLAVGTGIGAGIIINGEVLRGSNDIAGAIGWLALDRPFQKKYIQCGCFEHYASGEGIVKAAKEFIEGDETYAGVLKKKTNFTSHDVFNAYEQKDIVAEKTLKLAIEFWGMTAANFVSIFNPEKIIWGGGVFGPAVQFLDEIYDEASKWAQP
ncbi:MAG: ROK family protein, partial [Ignavibacteriaceae bacterium]|nr:ROK family protein [Ignavibacteriaceae bacterium]